VNVIEEKREARISRKNASHASRSGAVSRERVNNNNQPTMYKEKYHQTLMGARSEDDDDCACRVDKHKRRRMPN